MQTIQCIESIIDRVVNLFTHLRSLQVAFWRADFRPVFEPFFEGSENGSKLECVQDLVVLKNYRCCCMIY